MLNLFLSAIELNDSTQIRINNIKFNRFISQGFSNHCPNDNKQLTQRTSPSMTLAQEANENPNVSLSRLRLFLSPHAQAKEEASVAQVTDDSRTDTCCGSDEYIPPPPHTDMQNPPSGSGSLFLCSNFLLIWIDFCSCNCQLPQSYDEGVSAGEIFTTSFSSRV